MKRWMFRILILLILGAATTVAVAWVLSRRANYYQMDLYAQPTEREKQRLGFGHGSAHGVECDVIAVGRSHGFGWDRFSYYGGEHLGAIIDDDGRSIEFFSADDSSFVVSIDRVGWPWPSLCGEHWLGPATRDNRECVIAWEVNVFEWRYLPLRPIFPGFLLNTLFYAAIWFGLLFAVGFARKALRKKRGRCVQCNYDLRGNLFAGCSECGWQREERPA